MPRQAISALSVERIHDEHLEELAKRAFVAFANLQFDSAEETVKVFEASTAKLDKHNTEQARAKAFALITLRELRLHSSTTDAAARDFHDRVSQEIRELFDRSPQTEPLGFALNLFLDAYFAYLCGADPRAFEGAFDECLRAAEQQGGHDDRPKIKLLKKLTTLRAQVSQNPAQARSIAVSARRIVLEFEPVKPESDLAHTLTCEEARLAYNLRQFATAEPKFRQLISASWNPTEASLYIARICVNQGRYHRAFRMFESSLREFINAKNVRGQISCIQEIARLRLVFLAYEEAGKLYELSLNMAQHITADFEIARARFGLGIARYYLRDAESAVALLKQSYDDFKRLKNSGYELRASCWYATALSDTGDFKKADAALRRAKRRINALIREGGDANAGVPAFLFERVGLSLHSAVSLVRRGNVRSGWEELAKASRELQGVSPSSEKRPPSGGGMESLDSSTTALWRGRVLLDEAFILLQEGGWDPVDERLELVTHEIKATDDHRLSMEHSVVAAFAAWLRGKSEKVDEALADSVKEAKQSRAYSNLDPKTTLLRQFEQYERLTAPGEFRQRYQAFHAEIASRLSGREPKRDDLDDLIARVESEWHRELVGEPVRADAEETGADERHIRELISATLDMPAESGRNNLIRLISAATQLEQRAKQTGNEALLNIASRAWTGMSTVFRRYRENLNRAIVEGSVEADPSTRRLMAVYEICELDVRNYESLEELEAAATSEVEAMHGAWRTLEVALAGNGEG